MPRDKRLKTNTKVYHIIDRGINKQEIFLDKQDIIKYLEEIKKTKEKYKYELLAYAFMNDHVHLLIYDINDNISTIIQSLKLRYSIYFNKKYERTGHLFENRFKSRVIESAAYLRTVVRYIHKNPENAGLQPYVNTSYNEYLCNEKIINSKYVLKLFGDDKKTAIENFIYFHNNFVKSKKDDLEYECIRRISDEEAINIIKKISNEDNLMNIQKYSKENKYQVISKILEIEEITKTQISRITGICTKTIKNIEKNSK